MPPPTLTLPSPLPSSLPQVRTETGDFDAGLIFEQDPVQIVDALLPLYMNATLLRSLQEALASELAARMNAMNNASDNAGELKRSLTLIMNRKRQAKITTVRGQGARAAWLREGGRLMLGWAAGQGCAGRAVPRRRRCFWKHSPDPPNPSLAPLFAGADRDCGGRVLRVNFPWLVDGRGGMEQRRLSPTHAAPRLCPRPCRGPPGVPVGPILSAFARMAAPPPSELAPS